jgi:DHA2 family multidrug resistance protein
MQPIMGELVPNNGEASNKVRAASGKAAMTTQAEPPQTDTPAVWAGFAMMCLGMFMAILDVQVVATSLPTIQAALSVRPDQMSWIQTAYLIAEVVAIPLTGFLTRWIGMRRLFVIGVSVFTLASAGCAASDGFAQLIALRVLQGFSGGMLIPAVFSAVFLLFPAHRQGLATTIAGVLAVLAPTVGPVAGGWITETYSWRWLFLINLAPGVLAALGALLLLPREPARPGLWRTLDLPGLALMATALTALEIGLKDAPGHGWSSPLVLGLFALSAVSAAGFVRRALGPRPPVVELRTLRDRNFAIGALLSFTLGIGLFGSVYLMPVFLALVRGHHALRIGEIMLVTGAVQLLTAPIAVALEPRIDARWLAGFGFLLFAVGLGCSANQTPQTDFAEMVWPQILRGGAIMFCLLPPAADPPGPGPVAARGGARRQRPVQPDAEPRRSDRPHPDRHRHLRTRAAPRRRDHRAAAGGRRRDRRGRGHSPRAFQGARRGSPRPGHGRRPGAYDPATGPGSGHQRGLGAHRAVDARGAVQPPLCPPVGRDH